MPKSGLFIYGLKVAYAVNPRLSLSISSIMRISNSDFLDAAKEKGYSRDKFRAISIGALFAL